MARIGTTETNAGNDGIPPAGGASGNEANGSDLGFDAANACRLEQAVVHRLLTRLIPFLALLYVFNLLDRGNVANAALTMQRDLKLSDAVYGTGAGIFFIGYFLFEVPSNLIMERVGARRWITRILVSWGAISACMLFVRSPLTFYALRFLLGLAEAGFYPGVVLYLTYWVPGAARARVLSRFLALTSILGLVGGPLSGLLLRLNGVGGLRGWQWLFLLEGIPSMLLGIAVWFGLPDSPQQVAWLSPPEKAWLTHTLAQEERTSHRVNHMSFRVAFSNPRIVHLCVVFILVSTASNAVGFFSPKMLLAKSGGQWSDSFVATIGVIPALVGAIAMMLAAVHSDRTGKRWQHVGVGYALAGVAYAACVWCPNAWWLLIALSINALGERSAAGSYWALTSSLLGARAAAGGIAFINSVGNLGGFLGPKMMGAMVTNTGSYTGGLWIAAAGMVVAGVVAVAFGPHLSGRSADVPLET